MSWKQQKIKAEAEVAFRYFYDTGSWTTTHQQVPLSQVTGSLYFGAYVGETWQYMRQHLKRRFVTEMNCDELIDCPQRHGADELAFVQFGQEYFITCGHHRTCIARFMGRELVPAQVSTYAFDHVLFGFYHQLARAGFRVDVHGTPASNLHHPVWQLTAGSLAIILYGREGICSFASYYEQLRPRGWRRGLALLSQHYQPACPVYHWPVSSPGWGLRWGLLRHWQLKRFGN